MITIINVAVLHLPYFSPDLDGISVFLRTIRM